MKKGLLGVSLFTVTIMYALLAAVVVVVCEVCGLPAMYGIIGAVIVLFIQFLVSPFFTDLTMKWFYRAKFNAQLPDCLESFISQVCEEKHIKKIKIGYIDDGAPNAFTYGRTKNSSRIVITRGIVELLDPEEAKAVIAHEIGHAVHYDMLLMTAVQIVPLIFYGIFKLTTETDTKSKSDSSSKDSKNYLALIGLVCGLLYLISEYLILWLSRVREYYADEFAVKTTKNPSALAQALVKIGFGLSTKSKETSNPMSVTKANALGISDVKSSRGMVVASFDASGNVSKTSIQNAMKWEMQNPWAKLYQLSSTHPLISKRILAISSMCRLYGQDPYITYEKDGEKYAGHFFKEILISVLPLFALIVFAVAGLAAQLYFIIPLGLAVSMVFSLIALKFTHPKKFEERTVESLLAETKVSGITSVPCTLTGNIIGRGDPGCIFSENFVIKDSSGIIFLNYKQPLVSLNKLFAIFRAGKYIDRDVKITGWYRRAPIPYVELLKFEVDNKVHRCHSYGAGKVFRYLILLLSLAATAIMIV